MTTVSLDARSPSRSGDSPRSDATRPFRAEALSGVVAQCPIAVQRLARWRRHGVLYETHLAHFAGGVSGVVVSALGPGRRHRFALMPDSGAAVRLSDGWEGSDAELTAAAEALLQTRYH